MTHIAPCGQIQQKPIRIHGTWRRTAMERGKHVLRASVPFGSARQAAEQQGGSQEPLLRRASSGADRRARLSTPVIEPGQASGSRPDPSASLLARRRDAGDARATSTSPSAGASVPIKPTPGRRTVQSAQHPGGREEPSRALSGKLAQRSKGAPRTHGVTGPGDAAGLRCPPRFPSKPFPQTVPAEPPTRIEFTCLTD